MSLRSDRRGFIFSLDAALAVLVTLIVVAGVARVGNPGVAYEQHGYLRLERYANDALEVMQITGTFDNIENLLANGEDSLAESLAENELLKIMPGEVQFRFAIGSDSSPRLDNVYPSAGNHAAWYDNFTNAAEIAVASRVLHFSSDNMFDCVAIYVWRGERI